MNKLQSAEQVMTFQNVQIITVISFDDQFIFFQHSSIMTIHVNVDY